MGGRGGGSGRGRGGGGGSGGNTDDYVLNIEDAETKALRAESVRLIESARHASSSEEYDRIYNEGVAKRRQAQEIIREKAIKRKKEIKKINEQVEALVRAGKGRTEFADDLRERATDIQRTLPGRYLN